MRSRRIGLLKTLILVAPFIGTILTGCASRQSIPNPSDYVLNIGDEIKIENRAKTRLQAVAGVYSGDIQIRKTDGSCNMVGNPYGRDIRSEYVKQAARDADANGNGDGVATHEEASDLLRKLCTNAGE